MGLPSFVFLGEPDFVVAVLDAGEDGGKIRTCCETTDLSREDLTRLREFLQEAGY